MREESQRATLNYREESLLEMVAQEEITTTYLRMFCCMRNLSLYLVRPNYDKGPMHPKRPSSFKDSVVGAWVAQ